MSDKIQHTSTSLRQQMLNRYGEEFHHKHNKNHLHYREHFKTHPCNLDKNSEEEPKHNGSTGLIRQFKLRKMRKRLDKGRIH